MMKKNVNLNKWKGGVCKTRIPCYKKYHAWFAGTVTRPVFLCLQMKQHDLDFTTRENGKQLFFFLLTRSGFYNCRKVTFIVMLYLDIHLEQRTPSICISVFCALAKPLELLNTYFSCLAYLFPTFTKFTSWFR